MFVVSGLVRYLVQNSDFMDRPPSDDDRSAISLAYAWATRVMVIAVEMVLPGLLGLWIDQKLGTVVLFALAGFALGITVSIMHLVRMAKSENRTDPTGKHKSP